MKKFRIQITLALLLTFAVMLLTATCYLSYHNLSSIASSIKIDLNPEFRLVTIREVSHELETADNSIRIYTITRDTSDLRSYYNIISGIDEKVDRLRFECRDDSIMISQVDTISSLIEENIVTWNNLLYITSSDNLEGFLKHLSDRINKQDDNKEKKGILKRVFAKNDKDLLMEQELKTDIHKIEEQGRITQSSLKTNEAQLAAISSRIKEKFYDLITRMENQVSQQVKEKSREANLIAERTYKWVITFSISGGLLVLLVLFIIIRYIRNAHAYQVALMRSKTETETLAKTKELFMANISHEIRTPVTAISGFAEQLLHENLDENAQRSLKIIKSSSDHLAKIIDDILDISKLQNGKLRLEKTHFRLENIFEDVYNIFKRQARIKKIGLSYMIEPGTPPVLLGDPYRLKQIMINLVGNSLKFTEHGTVRFSARSTSDDSGRADLLMEFTDTGIGIDEGKLKFIFDDFTQEETSTARKYGGTGLGLSIVKKLVDLHHGSITCESRKNKGTTITCQIPFETGREDQLEKEIPVPLSISADIKSLRILIADDEEYNRLLFKKILDRWGIKCDLASTAMEAIAILKDNKYDLLFMDVRMPGLDGYKATEFIRNDMNISNAEMQVICVSAVSFDEEGKKMRQSGMNAFLRKPFTEEMLLSSIVAARQRIPYLIPDSPAVENIEVQPVKSTIDLDNLYHISGGDNQFVMQMLISFNSTTERGLNDMVDAALSGQWDSVADLAHKMMPPCRHIGAKGLYSLLDKIKISISEKERDAKTLEALIRNSVREFESVSEIVKDYISRLK